MGHKEEAMNILNDLYFKIKRRKENGKGSDLHKSI